MVTSIKDTKLLQICNFYFLSLSAYLFAYFLFILYFSLFFVFRPFLFSPPSSLYIHTFFVPFTFLGKRRDINYRYNTCPCRTGCNYRYVTPPPHFIFFPIPIFLSFLRVRKFSFCFSFSSFLSFLPYSFSRFLFGSFFFFSLIPIKKGEKDFLTFEGNLSSQPLFNYKINKQGRLPAVQIPTEVWKGSVDRLGYLDLVLVSKMQIDANKT